MDELAPGIHRWTAPHPEWRPKAEEVECYALVAGEALLLVDPLLPADADERHSPLLAALELLVAAATRVELLVTVPYQHAQYRGALRALRAGAPHAHLGSCPRAQATAAGDAARRSADGRRRHGGPIARGAAEAGTPSAARGAASTRCTCRRAAARRRVRRRRGRHSRWPPLLVSEQHQRRLVPRRVARRPRAPGRATPGARAGHPRPACDRRRTAAAGAVPGDASGADVLTPATSARRPSSSQWCSVGRVLLLAPLAQLDARQADQEPRHAGQRDEQDDPVADFLSPREPGRLTRNEKPMMSAAMIMA